jgi:cyclophilin family peptidyl-prolyl cis-trans isomerase
MNRCFIEILMVALCLSGSALNAETADKATKVRLKTNKGDLVIELNAEKAPVTVQNFKAYVKEGFYQGTVFHRVIDGFMIQGGGFAKEGEKFVEKKTRDPIVNESNNGLKNEVGTIAMARTSKPDSATSQFFINVADNSGLDFPSHGGYAVFGKVIEGMEVVHAIRAVETRARILIKRHPETGELIPDRPDRPSEDVPVEPVVIESALLE